MSPIDDGRAPPAMEEPVGGLSFLPQMWYGGSIMTATVERIADEVRSLPKAQLDELLAWLAEYELQHPDEWDQEIERDSQPGGRLQEVIDRARQDIAAGRGGGEKY